MLHGEGAQQRGRDVQRVKCLQECEGWFVCHLRDCNAERVYQTTWQTTVLAIFVQKLWAMAKQPSVLVRRVQSCETLRHHPQAGRWTLTGVSATVEDI